MAITLRFDELLAHTDDEREKWNQWLRAQSDTIWQLPVQPHGRFPTVWSLLDHLFIVEQRHLQRLRGEYPLGTVKKSMATITSRWFSRKASQRFAGSPRCRTRFRCLATVRSEMRNPSFSNSP
jgi:hypothetical protein